MSILQYTKISTILVYIFTAMEEELPKSKIEIFYMNKNVFITGGSGFMGKVLLEKLLYHCSDLNKIYVLMRVKRGRSVETRLDDMFKLPVSNHAIYVIFFSLSNITQDNVIIFKIFVISRNTI